MIDRWLSQHELASARFDLLNPAYKPGSAGAYATWALEIMLPADKTEALLKDIQATLNDTPVFPSSNAIGGKVAGDTQLLAIYALLASMVMIVIYVWIRFQNVMFGLAAVLATFHDVLVAVGFLALSKYLAPFLGWAMVDDFKISLAVVAALLTIVGYSINDTIVIFDRIREIRGKNPDLTEAMINLSVNQCLGRTILTSGTVLIGTTILYFFGGQGIHPFAYTMLVGLVSGTYSTVYIASPMLLLLRRADETRGDVKPAPALAGGKSRS
jgi:SecD/SecF fusion protein